MCSAKFLNSDGLNELFDLPNEPALEKPQEIIENASPETISTSAVSDDEINSFVRGMMKDSKTMMSEAIYVLKQSPMPETVEAASKMMGSIYKVIAELNKLNLMQKKHENQKELEKLKAELKAKAKPALSPGSKVNIQNNMIPYTQENMIKMMKDASFVSSLNNEQPPIDIQPN